MRMCRFIISGVSLVSIVASGELVRTDFSRYEPILTRKPFGVPAVRPPDGGTNAAPLLARDALTRTLRLCALREDADGLRVGFLDTKVNPPKSYYLRVGETEDGYQVMEASFSEDKALIGKDGREEWLKMGSETTLPAGSGPAVAASAAAEPRPTGAPAASYADRLRQRREMLQQRTVEPPKLSGPALEDHLRTYQMDLIRKGQPALPIPLTKEMDDQLVAEGVLPPNETPPQP